MKDLNKLLLAVILKNLRLKHKTACLKKELWTGIEEPKPLRADCKLSNPSERFAYELVLICPIIICIAKP